MENKNQLIGKVVVYGGGNSAMDIARTAIRMGAQDVVVVSREEKENMSAHPFEILETLEEGGQLLELRSITSIDGNTITLEKLKTSEEIGRAHV